MKCIQIKSDDTQCLANALRGSEFCFSHDPDKRSEKLAAVRKGGLASKVRKKTVLKPPVLRQPSDALNLIEDTINRLRTEPMSTQQANSIASLVSLTFKLKEVEDF